MKEQYSRYIVTVETIVDSFLKIKKCYALWLTDLKCQK